MQRMLKKLSAKDSKKRLNTTILKHGHVPFNTVLRENIEDFRAIGSEKSK